MSRARELGEAGSVDFLATQGRRNLIINGGFDVWQQGDGPFTSSYNADQFRMDTSNNAVAVTRSAGINKKSSAARIEVITALDTESSSNSFCALSTSLELSDIKNAVFGQGKLALSFLAKSNMVGTYTATLAGVHVDTSVSGVSSIVIGKEFHVSEINTYQKHTLIFNRNEVYDWLDSAELNDRGLQVSIILDVGPGRVTLTEGEWMDPSIENRAGAMVSNNQKFANTVGNYFTVTEMQLELGDTATPFEQRSYGEELALCQRYYQNYYEVMFASIFYSASNSTNSFNFAVRMREIPIITITETGALEGHTFSPDHFPNDINESGFRLVENSMRGRSNYQTTRLSGVSFNADARL